MRKNLCERHDLKRYSRQKITRLSAAGTSAIHDFVIHCCVYGTIDVAGRLAAKAKRRRHCRQYTNSAAAVSMLRTVGHITIFMPSDAGHTPLHTMPRAQAGDAYYFDEMATEENTFT